VFPNLIPGYILAGLFIILDIYIFSSSKASRPILSLWALPISLTALIYWCVCVHKIHRAVLVMSDNCYPISPARAVGFGFLPIYNIYWMFKWPAELINFINTRSGTGLNLWIPGTIFILSAIASRIDGAIWMLLNFGVLSYLIGLLKKSLAMQAVPMPYKRMDTNMSAGAVVGIIFLCALPIIGLMAAIAVPNFIMAREAAIANSCVNNLKQIQAAKLAWAADTGASKDATPSWDDLMPKYLSKQPICVKGGTYTIVRIDSCPVCSVGDSGTVRKNDDHVLKE